MKKRVCAVFLIFALSLTLITLSGCHGSRGREIFKVPEVFDESKSYTISFWAKNDTNNAQISVYRQAIEDFKQLYPNINVELVLYTDYSRIYSDVITNIATDTTPNVCITYPDHIATYLKGNNTVVPLDSLFADAKYGFGGSEIKYDGPSADQMITKFLDECVIDGSHYAIPYMRSTEACYINKTYVEKLGYELPETLTWDFIWEVSDAAMKKNEDGTYFLNGKKEMYPFIYKSTDNMMIQLLKQKDAGYSDSSGDILIFNDTTKEMLTTVADHVKTGAFTTFKRIGYPGNYLNSGKCVFGIDSTAGATWMGKSAPHSDISEDTIVDFEMVVKEIPQFDTSSPKMISQGPSVCVFNKADPQEVLASWLFAQFLLTNKVQISYSQTEGYVPVTHKAQQSEEYIDYLSREGEDDSLYYSIKIQASKLLIKNVDNTFITPVFAGSASLRDAAGQLIENVAKRVRQKKEVNDEYFPKLYEDVTSLYRLDQMNVSEDESGKPSYDLGPLPNGAIALMVGIGSVWVIMAVYTAVTKIKAKKNVK